MASLEGQLVQILANTQVAEEGTRKQAELDLRQAATNPTYPVSLVNIAAHTSVAPNIRQQALLVLRTFIDKRWVEKDIDGNPQVPIPEEQKVQLRSGLLELSLGCPEERLVKSSAGFAVSKIASFDFPEQWPDLLPTLIALVPTGTETQLDGALKVLNDIVEESLSEDQFFNMAKDIVSAMYGAATNDTRPPVLRALAVGVFRSCFDLMEIVKEDHKDEVTRFAEEALQAWFPFFEQVMRSRLPEHTGDIAEQPEAWNGPVALKLQVVKTLIKVKAVFPSLLLQHTPTLFSVVWEELGLLLPSFEAQYIGTGQQGRLSDSDNLPKTLDFLVLEELDFFNQCLRAPPVQKELETQMAAHPEPVQTPWLLDLMKLVVSYGRITSEEESLWEIDRSLYLAEETSISINYTPRTACGDLLIKLGEWLKDVALDGLYAFTKGLFSNPDGSLWKTQEAALYLFTMLVSDFMDRDKPVRAEVASAYFELVQYALSRQDEPLLRARGYLVAGLLSHGFPQAATILDGTVEAMSKDDSELVQVACIKAIEGFMQSGSIPVDRQLLVVHSISTWLDAQDIQEIEDADDLLVTIMETLRAALSTNWRAAISDEVPTLDLLFALAKYGAQNFQVEVIVVETFEEIVQSLNDPPSFAILSAKVLPLIMKSFDVADVTSDHPLIAMAADILVVLCEHGCEPLPDTFVSTCMPKLGQLLMSSNEGEVLRPAAEAVKFMLMHDHAQVFAWTDATGKSGLEACLIIIDRLLGSDIEDTAASEVGGLAAELVEKAGAERLGPFMAKLLEAVAGRLATAEAPPFIQSLILVFARLSLVGAQDVVEFLSQIQVSGKSGLDIVLGKWLENSVSFAGYDEIRQNVIALSKLYSLNDQRVAQTMVKGDLIVPTSNRIITRSQAKKHPDQFTTVPAPLKIIKVLVEELLSAAGQGVAAAVAASAAAQFIDEDEGDDGWEDVADIDVMSKGDMMSYLEGGGLRQRDDETQAYLSEFFLAAARDNTAGFQSWYEGLTEDEKLKLNELAAR